jgi:hypothetical protein
MVIGLAREAEDSPLARGELDEGLRAQSADRLATVATGLDDAGRAEPTQVPRDERLREADMGDEFRHRRLAAGESADDAQAVHVGHDLVEGTQLAKVFGLNDDGGDRAADPCGRG